MKRHVWMVWLAVFGVATAFATGDAAEVPDDTADNVFLGEQDLAERMEIWRNQYRRMTPGDAPLEQDVGTWPAAWGEFSRAWDAAPAERDLATWLVPVVSERTGSLTVLRDANGNALWIGATDFAKEGSESVTLTGTLVSEEEWVLWQAARGEIERRLGLMREESPGGGMRGGLYTNGLRFTNIWAESNGDFRLDLAWESNGEVQVFCRAMHYEAATNTVVWTNDENEVVTNDVVDWRQVDGEKFNGTSDTWALLGVAAVTNGTGSFTDSGFAEEYGRVRFYAAAALADTDGDGLTDGHEWLASHTEADNPDSDGDGVGDGAEAAMGADPADPAVSPMVTINAVLYTPADTNNLEKQWVELYSAAAETMDLSGFRLEVGQSGGWSNAVAFGSGTCIEPGRCLLVGGGQVTNADIITNALAIPQPGRTDWPTGVRLVWGGATNGNVVDTVMLGGHTNFNLDVAGWMSPTSIWTYAGKAAVRRYPGWDTDRAEDWTWAAGRTGQNSSVEIDTDGDGLSDAVERAGTANANTNAPWFGEPTDTWNTDSDGDGLSDYAECVVHGTNPNTWASDGDIWPWMPEGTMASNWPGSDSFEVASGYWNPLVKDQNENGFPDSWEMVLGLSALQNGGDSDGDGVDDVTEIQQNSNPQNAADSAPKPYVVRYESSKPGWRNGGGANDVGWKGWVDVHFMGAKPGQFIYTRIEEGTVLEEFAATWKGTQQANSVYSPAQNTCFSWAVSMSRPVLRIADSGLHGNFLNSPGGEYSIAPFDLRLSSMQENSNASNRIFNSTRKDDPADGSAQPNSAGETFGTPRNKLYVVVPPAESGIRVNALFNSVPSFSEGPLIAAFYRDGVKVEGTDAMCQTTTPMFSPMDANLASEAEFELKAGCDLNGNGVLDGDEAAELVVQDMDGEAIGPPIVSAISNLQYEDDVQFVNGIVNLSYPVLHHAARLLKIFRDGHTGGIPQDYCPFDLSGTAVSLGAFDDCSGFSEWLTHNSGAPFNGDGICSIKEYHWLPDSSLGTLVATAKPLNPLVGAAYQSWVVSRFYETAVRPQAAAYLRTNPVGTIATFPLDGGFYEVPLMQYQQEADAPFQPAWVEGTTILVHNLDGESCHGLLSLIDDANGSIGRGRLTSIGYQFTVEKVAAWANLACLESIRVVGTIEDLYDFNRESGWAASAAASLQIGHGNGSYGSGRSRGKIFRTRVDVDHIFHPNGIGFAAVEIPE